MEDIAGEREVKDSTKGTMNELRAINEFIEKGCVVCKNVEAQGPFDISVTWPNGDIELLDVKTPSFRNRDGSPINRSLTPAQEKLGVRIFYKDKNIKGHYHPSRDK